MRNKTIKNIISLAITVALIATLIAVYRKYNFNDFIKSISIRNVTTFERDKEEKCSQMDSYKIKSDDYNDALFYETVSVIPNTSYKVTCKVKVENVENKSLEKEGGANICITDTIEHSKMITRKL